MNFKPKEMKMAYLGVENPSTPAEIQFEISGLETLIAEAKYKISQLKQGEILAQCLSSGKRNDNSSS